MMFSLLITFLGLATAVFAETIDVKVGDGGLTFDPNSVTAQVGDTVRFKFYSGTGSHSVALSSFDTPCQPATDGFYSGIIQGNQKGDHTFTINITSTDALWFYCSVGTHCQNGMVGVVNPPSDQAQSITAYASAASSILRQTLPGSIQGGIVATSDSSTPTPASPRPSLTATTSVTSETVPSSVTVTTGGGGSTVPVSTTSSGSGGGSGGASTTTTPSGTSASSSPSVAATTTSGGRKSEWSVILWLSVILGGLVALMA